MASKENQEALDLTKRTLQEIGFKFHEDVNATGLDIWFNTLQKAIDNEELYKKAFNLVLNQLSKYEYSDVNWLEQARKELENE